MLLCHFPGARGFIMGDYMDSGIDQVAILAYAGTTPTPNKSKAPVCLKQIISALTLTDGERVWTPYCLYQVNFRSPRYVPRGSC